MARARWLVWILGTCFAFVVPASTSAVAEFDGSQAGAGCSRTGANEILASLGYRPDLPSQPIVGQVLCGPFIGAGSRAMVITLAKGTCRPNGGWRVLGLVDGRWKVVFNGDELFGVLPFVRVGNRFRERIPVSREGDSPCFPTGGSRGRVWRWNGRTFVHGRFKRLTVGAEFFAPGRKLGCVMGDYPATLHSAIGGATCVVNTHPLTATIALDDSLRFCPTEGQTFCYGGIGRDAPTLAYGKRTTIGRFRCASLRAGVRCTNVETGKGFLIDEDSAQAVAPR